MKGLKGTDELKRLDAQKRKDLPNGVVFSKVDDITEMHPITKLSIEVSDGEGRFYETTVSELIGNQLELNNSLQKALKIALNEIKELKERVEKYGI